MEQEVIDEEPHLNNIYKIKGDKIQISKVIKYIEAI